MLTDSLRGRLTIWYTAVLALVLVSFAAVSYFAIASAADRAEDEAVRHAGEALASAVREEASHEEMEEHGIAPGTAPGWADDSIGEVVRAFRFGDFRFFVFDDDRRLLATAGEASALPPAVAGLATADVPPEGRLATFDGERVFVVRAPTASGVYTVVVVHALEEQMRQVGQVRRAYAIAVPVALLIAAVGGYMLARRSLVQIEAAFEQQRRFMADASHELRTPVAIVRGEAEVALSRGDRDAEDYRDSLEIIHDEGRRLTGVVDDLFMLARADAGQRPLVLADVDVAEVVSESVRAVRTLAEQRGVTVAAEPTTDELPLRADAALLSRMFLNLLDNAIKYSPEGGRVRVRTERRGGAYVVTVEDTGMGIPAEAQPFVFDRFYRADKARARPKTEGGGGAGLGLSIARWIAEAHGGRLDLVRSSEQGTVFAVTLPVK